MQAAQNYIYIVLAVLYIIYSIIQAGKKAAKNRPTVSAPSDPQRKEEFKPVKPPSSAPPQHDTAGDLKKMLEELLGGGSEEVIPEKPVSQPDKPKPPSHLERAAPTKIVTHAAAAKAAPSHFPSKTKDKTKSFLSGEKKIQENAAEAAARDEEKEIDFDIRQAIIYSEILKRPQY